MSTADRCLYFPMPNNYNSIHMQIKGDLKRLVNIIRAWPYDERRLQGAEQLQCGCVTSLSSFQYPLDAIQRRLVSFFLSLCLISTGKFPLQEIILPSSCPPLIHMFEFVEPCPLFLVALTHRKSLWYFSAWPLVAANSPDPAV